MVRKSSTEKTDEEIVRLIIAGDVELFAQIIDRYQTKLIAYARRIVFSQQAAGDVAQNVFIKSYQNLQSFKMNKKFSSWIYRIAHNEAEFGNGFEQRRGQSEDGVLQDGSGMGRHGMRNLDEQISNRIIYLKRAPGERALFNYLSYNKTVI